MTRPDAELDRTVIRSALVTDAPGIARVLVESWRQTHVGIVAQEYIDSLSIEAQTVRWQKRLENQRIAATAVVAQNESHRAVAFAAGGPIREPHAAFDGELYAIYVNTDIHRRGLGRRLLTEWAQRAVSQGFHSAIVRVFTANQACAFYERLGARHLKEGSIELAGVPHTETWLGWDNLDLLSAADGAVQGTGP